MYLARNVQAQCCTVLYVYLLPAKPLTYKPRGTSRICDVRHGHTHTHTRGERNCTGIQSSVHTTFSLIISQSHRESKREQTVETNACWCTRYFASIFVEAYTLSNHGDSTIHSVMKHTQCLCHATLICNKTFMIIAIGNFAVSSPLALGKEPDKKAKKIWR